MHYIIHLDGNLTSYVFYNEVLGKLHNYYIEGKDKQLVFDFSQVKTIDPAVIPNLLCVGHIVTNSTGIAPKIFIPNNISAGKLKRYLYDIQFITYAQKYGFFSFDDSIWAGMSESNMDKLNTTVFFGKSETEQESWSKIQRYCRRFSNKFLERYNSYITPVNLILELSKEIVENSKEHGESFCFMTLQYNYSREKVYISYSDCGKGFFNSLKSKELSVENELDAIVNGVYLRYEKPYGLYSVIKKTIASGGVVRIHSNKDQLILTQNMTLPFEISNTDSIMKKLLSSDYLKNNIRKNLKFSGVHIEIEIPLSKGEVNRNV